MEWPTIWIALAIAATALNLHNAYSATKLGESPTSSLIVAGFSALAGLMQIAMH